MSHSRPSAFFARPLSSTVLLALLHSGWPNGGPPAPSAPGGPAGCSCRRKPPLAWLSIASGARAFGAPLFDSPDALACRLNLFLRLLRVPYLGVRDVAWLWSASFWGFGSVPAVAGPGQRKSPGVVPGPGWLDAPFSSSGFHFDDITALTFSGGSLLPGRPSGLGVDDGGPLARGDD